MENFKVGLVGAQVILEITNKEQLLEGRVSVHYEHNGLSGISCPVWANEHVQELVILAARHMHEAANKIGESNGSN